MPRWQDGAGDSGGPGPVGIDIGSGGLTTADANREYGRVMDFISEGPVHGPVNGLKSFFLDDTPIQNQDGTFNFDGIIVQATKGTKSQSPIPGFPESENEVAISAGAFSIARTWGGRSGALTFTVNTPGLTHLRLRVGCPTLKTTNLSTGATSGASVQFSLKVKSDGTGNVYQSVTLDNNGILTGEYNSKYTKSYKFKLPPMTSGGWTFLVERITADSVVAPNDGVQNDTYVYSYTEIVEGQFIHPWTAKSAIILDSKKFPNIPRRGFEWDGRVIKIPSNYTPPTLTTAINPTTGVMTNTWTPAVYSGNWDGTFKDSPTVCFNPAWQFFDLASHTRYGAGNYLDASKLDKWTLYSIGRYCDEFVSDGIGGQEPRFASSIYLQKPEDAIKVLINVASAFRGMLFYSSGLVTPSQDSAKPVWYIFTNSNVVDGTFKYSGTARKARHTSALVSWNDPGAGYVLTPELVEDNTAEGIAAKAAFGNQQLDSVLIGCTSRAGAIRFGQWQIITERTEIDSVEFSTMLEGVAIAPGRIIQVNDQFRSGAARFGGRVLPGATTTTIPLDGPVTLLAGHSYTLRVALPVVITGTRPDGSVYNEEGIKTETADVTNGPGTYTSLTLSTVGTLGTNRLSAAPQAFGQWLLSDGSVVPTLFKVIGVKESGGKYTVVGMQHNPAKYSLADTIGVLDSNVNLNATPFSSVGSVTVSSSFYVVDGQIFYRVDASWAEPATSVPLGYKAEISFNNGQWMSMVVNGTSASFDNAGIPSCKVRVRAIYRSGTSNPSETAYTIPTWDTTTPTSVSLT